MQTSLSRPELADILRFYADAGLDFALDEEPQDRLVVVAKQEIPTLLTQRPLARPAMVAASTAVPDDATVARALTEAKAATSFDLLKASLAAFDGCSLKFTAKNLVFADGNPDAKIMLVGDAPGRDEDLEGKPFVGKAGQLLDKMLAAIGLDRNKVYLTNMIYWRPPGNRTPTPMEIEICRPFIERHIELLNPNIIVFIGASSAKSFMAGSDSILRMRGQWQDWTAPNGRTIPALAMLNPDYLMRQPAQKKLAWRDLLSLKAKIVELGLSGR
jgi:uracil-DNA glycosylase